MKIYQALMIGLFTLFSTFSGKGQVIDIRIISDSLILGNHPFTEIMQANSPQDWPAIKTEANWKNAATFEKSALSLPSQWFRCRLTNTDTLSRRIGFYNKGAHLSILYILSNENEIKVQSGEYMPAKELQFVHDCNYSSFAIAPADTVWLYGYLRYSSISQSTQQYALYDLGYYHRKLAGQMIYQWGSSQYNSFVLGALAFAAIFIGLIGIWFKNSSYQYYILFLVGGMLFIAFKGVQYSYLGMMSQYLGRSRATFSESIQFLFFAAYGMFVLKLMQVERYPRIYKFGKWMVTGFLIYAIGMGIYLFSLNKLGPNTPWYVGSRIVAFAFSIYLLIAIIRQVDTPGKRFYIAGALSFMVFSFLGFLRQDHPNGLLGAFSPVWYIQTGILIEALLFGLALGYQMYLVEKEKRNNYKAYIHQMEVNEKLMKEMNEKLEITVAERTKELELEKEKQLRLEYEQKMTQLEMQALRSQMNPHFIFNSLNSIRYQIQSKQYESASQYLVKFSQLLRQTLENSRKDIVTLEEELKLTKLYLDIEGIRFGEAFDYQMEIDDTIDLEEIELPPLLLQPFAENAVKHGLMESDMVKKQILIQVVPSNGGCTISLEDNGIGRSASNARKDKGGLEHKSLGMQITNERMKVFTRKYGHRLVAEIIDKTENNKPTGTKIIIHYKPKYHV